MKAYKNYKDSSVPWIGEIPENWSVTRLKNLFSIKKEIAGELGHDVLSVTQTGLKIKDLTKNDGQLSMDYSKYQLVEPTDFVMNHMDLLTGWIDCSVFHGVTSPDYRVFKVKNGKLCDRNFFKYIFQLCYSQKIFYGLGQGVSAFGRWRLPTEQFLAFMLPLPPLDEQQRLSAYLDNKISLIETTISDKEEMLTLLAELRQAIISEAVTKGLDPHGEMKDSGVEWIGEIPVGWEVQRLKNVTKKIKTGGTPQGADEKYYSNEGICWFTPKDFSEDVCLSHAEKHLSQQGIEACVIFPKGSVLLVSIGATIGKVGYSIEECSCNQQINVIICNQKLFNEFITYYLKCSKDMIVSIAQFTTLPIINQTVTGILPIPLPPLEVQEQIVQYLDEKTNKIDQITADTKEQIKLLKEYRQSLISEVVTGKVEV